MGWGRRRSTSRSPLSSEDRPSGGARQTLQLVPIYCRQPATVLDHLAHRLEQIFPLRAERRSAGFDPEIALDRVRGQYNSRLFLAQLLRDKPAGEGRVLGITGLDLFIPVLSYVFGEALLNGQAAIISTHRLDNQLYGLPADPELLFDRVCKESIHELGHTFDLAHCHDSRCVMASSTTIDGIDMKSDHFCDACLVLLRRHPCMTGGSGSKG